MIDPTTPTESPGNAAPPAGSSATANAAPVSASGESPSTPPTTPATSARPDWLPESYWDADKSAPKGEELANALKEAGDLKAAADAAKAGIPDSADKYALDLPADFKLPDGFEIKADDPRIASLREAALEAGLSQEKFTGLFAKLASADAASQKAQADLIQQGKAARDAALGPQGAQRVDALNSWFGANADEATAKELSQCLVTPRVIEFMEKIAVATKNGGVPGFNGKGRDGGRTDGKPENWDSMSALDKRTWQLRQSK